ncbi:hypothetical protein F7725_023289 [Dissostichus mawsoni]|uniref:Uncharacterized protein n=1 Tax=Dissostichus mawsoni TaxID=36200 RepID=A0A7J5Z0A2_DISMA|nr:hypothetical protein F7725_023289 [Dissostichus mawsoni]
MDANEHYCVTHTVMFELTIQSNVINNTDETKEEQEGFSFQEDTVNMTASHHTADMVHFSIQPQQDTMKLKEQIQSAQVVANSSKVLMYLIQVICDSENQQNNSSTDTRLLPAETEALFTYDVSVCPDNEGDYTENENRLALEYEAEREKERCEERKKEEQKRRIERDFQMELKKIMEAEKLQQKELELIEKRAQKKLDQEMMLQREVIRNLQRRVEQERRMREEEQKRIKNEEDKRTRKEDEIRRKKDEEMIKKGEEEERKREEATMKMEKEKKMERNEAEEG